MQLTRSIGGSPKHPLGARFFDRHTAWSKSAWWQSKISCSIHSRTYPHPSLLKW